MQHRPLMASVVTLALLASVMSGIAAANVTRKANVGPKVTISSQSMTAAAKNPTKLRPGERPIPKQFLTVYEQEGKRFAVVDQTVTGAPQGKVVISGTTMQALGLDRIDIISVRYPAPSKVEPAPIENEPEPSGRDITPNTYWKTWYTPWEHSHDTNEWNTDARAGRIAVGCENRTNRTVVVDCELTQSASDSVSVSSKLTFDQVLEIGFERGASYEDTVSMTVNEIPPMTRFKMTPMVERFNKSWVERRELWRCQRAAWWHLWCIDGTDEFVRAYTYNAQGRRVETFYGSLTAEAVR